MPLREFPAFHDGVADLDRGLLTRAVHQAWGLARAQTCPLYLGFLPSSWPAPVDDVNREVDAFFTLGGEFGFEQRDAVVTVGLHASRFVPILMWEALHVLRTGGTWIDVERSSQLGLTAIGAREVLERPYFRHCLELIHRFEVGGLAVRFFAKRRPTLLAARIGEQGWTFGILTAGRSENACRMVREICDLGLPDYEILICGPDPGPLPAEAPVRRFDLDAPEPRGWITRKKNLMAERAAHENLCLLHDRFVLPRSFLRANQRMGATQGFVTFPTVFCLEPSKSLCFRYVDYQYTRPTAHTFLDATRLVNFRLDQFCYPQYNDWREGCHVNGGAYIVRRSLWQAVPQDETLYHGDWEDVVQGIDCHRFGIPQRVNPYAVFESVYAHYASLNRFTLPYLKPDGEIEERRGYESAAFLALRALTPSSLVPIGHTTWARMVDLLATLEPKAPAGVARDLRALHSPAAADRADAAALWAALASPDLVKKAGTRDDLAALLEIIRRCAAGPIWHPNQTQRWLRAIELCPDRWLDLIEEHRRYFRTLFAVYPAFYETANEESSASPAQSKTSAAWLRDLHFRSPGARGILWAATSAGACPAPAELPPQTQGAPAAAAGLAVGLLPVLRALGSPWVARARDRLPGAARILRRMLGRVRPRDGSV